MTDNVDAVLLERVADVLKDEGVFPAVPNARSSIANAVLSAVADALPAVCGMSWVTDYDKSSPVDKTLFADPSIGNCPGCSNVRWHAKACPWVAGFRAAQAKAR